MSAATDRVAPDPDAPPLQPIGVAVDVILFTIVDDALQVLLVDRLSQPFDGLRAVPGGLVGRNEELAEAAQRILRVQAGLDVDWLEQLYTFDSLDRDPRRRVLSVSWYALVAANALDDGAALDTAWGAAWHPARVLPDLAFDHARQIEAAMTRLRYKIEYTPAAFHLLDATFTLSELQRVYEVILAQKLDKRNFRRRILALGLVEETEEMRRTGTRRPARLYRFRDDSFEQAGGGVLLRF